MNPATYRAQINAAIKPYGVKVLACPRNGGYSYFVDLVTGEQVGDSVSTYRQSFLPLDLWVFEAKEARDKHERYKPTVSPA